MKIVLEKNIPVPGRVSRLGSSESLMAMKAMEVNESFSINYLSAYYKNKKVLEPKVFVARREGKKFRIWRTA